MAKEDFFQEDDDEITFSLYNKEAVARLRKDGVIELPPKKVDIPKDKRWNSKQMTSKITHGILSGSSVSDIAESLKSVIGNNEASAIRNARTMFTSAENNGRLDSYKNLSAQGVVMKKEWEATPDDRTRPSHIDIDGEQQDIDKAFSNGCQFPGDGKGPAEEVWMCRCAMGAHIVGFRRKDGSISRVNYGRDKTSHDLQMAYMLRNRVSHVIANGRDISNTWVRRPDQFGFAIEDVINAQGFDGLPRVVSPEEFEKYVRESNGGNGFIAQRTYSAPDQETLDAYRKQLYEGKWYVDCSTGGAAYGRGMYGAYENGVKVSEYVESVMAHYKRGREFAYVETFTLDPSAKIINASEIGPLKTNFSQGIMGEIRKRGGFGNKEAVEWADMVNNAIQDDGTFAAMMGYEQIIQTTT